MNFSNWQQFSTTPGEYALNFQGKAGEIEAIITIPDHPTNYMAFLGHPHSLHGGSMNNKVITTLARAFKEIGIASLRYNFRGVGNSAGNYDDGVGESEDMLLLIHDLLKIQPYLKILLAGFSFGSYVVYRVAAHIDCQLLITIAPPVHHYNYQEFQLNNTNWLIFQGDADEVVPFNQVKSFANNHQPPLEMLCFPDTSHFFHGKLVDLKTQLIEQTQKILGKL